MRGHAKQLMTARVVSVSPETTLEQVVRALDACGFGGVPVVDAQGVPLGFLGETDVMRALLSGAAVDVPAADVMSAPIVVDEFETADRIMAKLRDGAAHHVLVARGDRLVGIISPKDVLRYFVARELEPPPERA
jgi:CBS domain-containing protein